jgi:(R,R)-butanediol dehydrogenase / meso-butanediol dehydrogenase / diacetyl reductase
VALTCGPVRAAVLTADGTIQVAEVDEPEATPGHVVVAVERCGICGSDLHLRHANVLPPGTVMGHELAGRVVERGHAAGDVEVGARVAVYPSAPCGRCRTCTEGRHELCLELGPTAIGLGPVPGGYAEYVLAAASSCFALPSSMSPDAGALVEPYAVGLHAVRRSRARPGDPVGVVGAGPIGLATVAALLVEGVTDVAVAERGERRRAVAEAMGVPTAEDAVRLDAALGDQPEVVFDCTGVGAVTGVAVQLARPGGRVVLVGVADLSDPVTLVGAMLVIKEVDLVSCLGYTLGEFGESVAAMACGALDPSLVVSAVRPLEDAERSFAELEQPGGPVKILLTPT